MMKAEKIGPLLVFLLLTLGLWPQFSRAASSPLRDQMIAQAKNEGEVVFMGDLATELKTLLKGFSKKYPFIQFKAIDARSEETINRVAAEARAGQLSIDVSGMSMEDVEPLLKGNFLAKFESPHLSDFQAKTQPRHGLYIVGQLDPIPHGVYSTKLVQPNEVPKSWDDFLNPKWKGKIIVSRSRNELPAKLAWLLRKGNDLNWEASFEFFRKLKDNEVVLGGSGINTHVSRLAAGEFPLFLFPASGSVLRLQNRGAPVKLITFPKLFGDYEVWTTFKGSAHPAAAWLLVDYFVSPEGQFEYTDTVNAVLPLNKKAKPGKLAQSLIAQGVTPENSDIMEPDQILQVFTDDVLKKAQDFYFSALGYK
jgi:iron(III) transport system substrate-binding protein